MGIICSYCDVDFASDENFTMGLKDIGIQCPYCRGTLIFEGYCPECGSVIEVSERNDDGIYRCQTCRKHHRLIDILNTRLGE